MLTLADGDLLRNRVSTRSHNLSQGLLTNDKGENGNFITQNRTDRLNLVSNGTARHGVPPDGTP